MRLRQARSGQVMPIVALMMVVIIGMAAFAVDGSNIYAQHRKMQADLDVAVKVAAAKMFDFNPSDAAYTSTAQLAIQSAAQILQQDGYPNGIVNAVYGSSADMAVSPLGTGLCGVDTGAGIKICTPPISSSSPFYGRFDYVEGFLDPDVHGFFGGVLGLDRVHISTRAVAWHGGADEPFAIIGLDSHPGDCSIYVNDNGSTLTVHGSIHANAQSCDNGHATVDGISESVITNTSSILGSMGTQNGGASVIDNPYSPTVPMTMANAITICSSGCNCPGQCTATSFADPSLPSWAQGTGAGSCFSNLQAVDPYLQVTPPSGVTYYLPPDAPNLPSLPWGSTAKVVGFTALHGEYDFFPHCDNTEPDLQTSAIYYFTSSGSQGDIETHSGPTINSFNSTFVLDPANSMLIHANGNSSDQWMLNAAINGPLQGIAMYENQPCTPTQSVTLNGNASDAINGIVDLACANVTVTGNSSDAGFVHGALVGWQVGVQGHGTEVDWYNPEGLPPDKGSVLVE